MESLHPKTFRAPPLPPLPITQKRKLIMGTQSIIFCAQPPATAGDADDHDLFTTTHEQQGGLADPFVTRFQVVATSFTSGHFRVQNDQPHTNRLVTLLNSPVDGALFTTSMPPPGDVPRINHCPMTLPLAP
jgi:hypothetical protein